MIIVGVSISLFAVLVWGYFIALDLDGGSPGGNRSSNPVSAQEGPSIYADIFADETGDDEIIAIVGTNPDGVITRGDLRVMAGFQTVHQQELSIEDAIDWAIVPLLDGAILYEEAVRLGHEPSDEEV